MLDSCSCSAEIMCIEFGWFCVEKKWVRLKKQLCVGKWRPRNEESECESCFRSLEFLQWSWHGSSWHGQPQARRMCRLALLWYFCVLYCYSFLILDWKLYFMLEACVSLWIKKLVWSSALFFLFSVEMVGIFVYKEKLFKLKLLLAGILVLLLLEMLIFSTTL